MEFTDKYGDVSVGYSENKEYNDEYEEMGLCCPFEHCIETCHLDEMGEETDISCPVFGHDCPGGVLEVTACNSAFDPWENILKRA